VRQFVISKNSAQFIVEVQSEWSCSSTPIFAFMALIRKTVLSLSISGFVRSSNFELLLPVIVENSKSICGISSRLLEYIYSVKIRRICGRIILKGNLYCCADVYWIYRTQDWDNWLIHVNIIVHLRISHYVEISFS